AEGPATAAGLDPPVGVENNGAADGQLRMHLLVVLRFVDPEREAPAGEPGNRAVGEDEPRFRRAGAGAEDPTEGVDRDVDHRDELADRNLTDDDLVRVDQEVRRLWVLARQR